MTNQEVIDYIESYGNFGLIEIPSKINQFIKDNYTKGNSEGKFYKVYLQGNDPKYGHYMVNPRTKHYRNSTFDEFYGGGIVD